MLGGLIHCQEMRSLVEIGVVGCSCVELAVFASEDVHFTV